MFADFLKRLTQPEPDPLDDGDARLALTALLVRVARSDGDYAQSERHQIESVVVFFPGLSFINEREVVDAKDTDDEHAREREKQKRTPETKFDSLARRSG